MSVLNLILAVFALGVLATVLLKARSRLSSTEVPQALIDLTIGAIACGVVIGAFAFATRPVLPSLVSYEGHNYIVDINSSHQLPWAALRGDGYWPLRSIGRISLVGFDTENTHGSVHGFLPFGYLMFRPTPAGSDRDLLILLHNGCFVWAYKPV